MDINEFIPLDNYSYREGFSNEHLVDQLNLQDREELESELIKLLQAKPYTDTLIVTTLSYLKSEKSLPLLYAALKKAENYAQDIIIGTSIYEINGDPAMITAVLDSFYKVGYPHYGSFFLFLKKLPANAVNGIIDKFTLDSDYLTSHNAKRALSFQWRKIKPIE